MQAFNGSQALKDEMVGRVRSQWAEGRLVAGGGLLWDDEKGLYSLNAALAETSDGDQFVARTGIPLEVALLCESTLVLNTVTVVDKSKKIGYAVVHDPALGTAVTDWLDAIRPGSDLQGVVPKFMVDFLDYVLSDGFAQRQFIPAEVRDAAEKILAHWKLELSGQAVDAKAWRQLRGEAVKATERTNQPWAYPISHFVETMAWPLTSMTSEFRQPYMFVTGSLLSFLQVPYHAEEDQKLSELALKGHLTMRDLDRVGKSTPEDRQAMLDANPDIKEAMTWYSDADRNARVKSAQQRAFAATTPLILQLMAKLVQFIKEA